MAKVSPRLAWMLTNSVCPSGLNVLPANSSLNRGRAGAADQAVERDVEDLAAAGQAAYVVVVDVVLAEHQGAAAAGRDVVREVEHIWPGRLVDEPQSFRPSVVRPHLSRPVAKPLDGVTGTGLGGATTLGRAEVHRVSVVDRALQAGEPGRALGPPLSADVVEGGVVGCRCRSPWSERERRVGVVDVNPCHPVARPAGLRGGEIGVGDALHGQHLQASPVAEPAGLHRIRGRDIAVEAGRETEVVLGEIEGPFTRVERHGLVGEAAGAGDRFARRLPTGGHLEDEAVTLGQGHIGDAGEVRSDIGSVDRLLAGHPAAPRHGPAAAVHLRAVQAREGADHLPEAGHLDGGRAALGHGVIRHAGVPEGWSRVVELVVPHQDVVAVRTTERSHPVVTPWQHRAVIEDDGRLGVVERAVAEPLRQPQPHGTVALVGNRTKRPTRSRRNRARDESRERSGQDRPTCHRRGTSQKRSPIELHHRDPPYLRSARVHGGTSPLPAAVIERRHTLGAGTDEAGRSSYRSPDAAAGPQGRDLP